MKISINLLIIFFVILLSDNILAQDTTAIDRTPAVYTPLQTLKELKVYPNPATDQLNILLMDNDSTKYELYIHSIQGKLIYQTKFRKSLSPSTLDVDVSTLKHGVYIITLRKSLNEIYKVKFIR